MGKGGKNYYELFEMSPLLSHAEIAMRLREATRFWTRRASNSPQIERRHEAELMLQCLAEAETVLLDPVKRRAYDELLKEQQPKRASHSTSSSKSSRRTSQQIFTCPRCGLRQTSGTQYCPVCGYKFFNGDSSSTAVPSPSSGAKTTTSPPIFPTYSQSPVRSEEEQRTFSMPAGNSFIERIRNLLGWGSLVGNVVSVTRETVRPQKNSFFSLLKLLLIVFIVCGIGLAVLPVIVPLLFILFMFSFFFKMAGDFLRIGGKTGIGFIAHTINSFVGSLIGHKFSTSREPIPVLNIRIKIGENSFRDVRIQGDIIAGNINVGDEVEVEGFYRGGTLIFQRGRNRKTNAKIIVKRR